MKKNKPSVPKPIKENLHHDPDLFHNEVWLTTEEVIEHLNISRSTIYRLRKKHDIPSFKLGRIPMFPKHLLNKVLLQGAMRHLKSK